MVDIVARQIVDTTATFGFIKPPIRFRLTGFRAAATATGAEGAAKYLKLADRACSQ